jgi:hypothetical protein
VRAVLFSTASRLLDIGGVGDADPLGARTTHRVVQVVEGDGVSEPQVVDRDAFFEVGAVEEDIAAISQADEPVTLSD